MNILYCFITFLFEIFVFAKSDQQDTSSPFNVGADVVVGKSLIFSHVLFRHGDRTPVSPYRNDPWGKREYWPSGFGQLTNIGKEQHYHLGQWLRNRYQGFLNSTYSSDEIYVRSTDVDRTLMSALSNLAGLYPPVDNDIWNKNITWEPIPVHTVPEKMDWVLAAKAPCPAYNYALSALQNSPEFKKINEKYESLYKYLSNWTGDDISTFQNVQYLNNTLFIEELYNRTLPAWTKKVYPGKDMTFLTNIAFQMYTYTRQLARLNSGPLIKEILERFIQKSKGQLTPDRKVWIYSAHDSTIASTLNALNLFEAHSPPYTACILFELWEDTDKNKLVSIYYKNTTAEPLPMLIPKCGVACPLEKMLVLYHDILPENWQEECKLSTELFTFEEANMSLALGILLILITLMLILSYVTTILYRRRRFHPYYSYS